MSASSSGRWSTNLLGLTPALGFLRIAEELICAEAAKPYSGLAVVSFSRSQTQPSRATSFGHEFVSFQ